MAHDATHAASNDHGHGEHVGHLVPVRYLVIAGLALLALTVITVAVRFVDLGEANMPIAMGVAVVKATIVALVFMHLRWDRPFNLLTYEDAVEWIELGIEELDARRMPPAQIESDLDYTGTKAPTAAEIAMLRAWVAAGKPQGDPADEPRLEPLPEIGRAHV